MCIFLLEARFNQLSTRKVSFEVFFRNIIRAARFCRRCSSLQHPSEISPTQHQHNQIMAARVKVNLFKMLPAWGMIVYPSLLLTLLLTYSTWSFQERFSSKTTPKKLTLATLFKVFPYNCIRKFGDLQRFCQLPRSNTFVLLWFRISLLLLSGIVQLDVNQPVLPQISPRCKDS